MGSVLDKNSSQVRKRIENHTFQDETGEEYEASEFKGFGDYFRRKKIKLQNLDYELRESASEKPQIFKGIVAHVSGYTQPPLHVYVQVVPCDFELQANENDQTSSRTSTAWSRLLAVPRQQDHGHAHHSIFPAAEESRRISSVSDRKAGLGCGFHHGWQGVAMVRLPTS
jgi:hypothetical protein